MHSKKFSNEYFFVSTESDFRFATERQMGPQKIAPQRRMAEGRGREQWGPQANQ